MKYTKIIATVLALALSLTTMTGCIQKKPVESTSSATEGSNSGGRDRDRTTYGTYAIPDTGRTSLVEMRVDSVEVVVWEQHDLLYDKVTTHNIIKVHVVITNLGEEDIELQPRDVRGFIDNEQLQVNTSEAAQEALGVKGDVIDMQTVHPGRSETGYMLYEYYRDWVEFEVQYKDTSLDFGIVFDANDVITLRTTLNSDRTTTDPSATGTDITEVTPTESGETAEPTPVETNASDLPGITIPVAGG